MKGLTYPLRHISIRVPWHDASWDGTVCRRPAHNTACLKLVNIAEGKDDLAEEAMHGASLRDLNSKQFPPCVKERATFMAPFALDRLHEHPYAWSRSHTHFKPTTLHYPPYGAAALPFRWMNKKSLLGDKKKKLPGFADAYPLEDLDQSLEEGLGWGFEPDWLQDHRNHRAVLDCFWSHVRPEESLVFFYAKQVPLIEDAGGRRVLIGAGRVLSIGPLTEYEYAEPPRDRIRSLLWERMVVHSVRPGFKDGFLLPYHEALAKSDDGRAFDPSEIVALAPEDRFVEFSYATEHVGHDASIAALLSCRAALTRSAELFNVAISVQESWIDQQLGRLWKKRGPFPGLGAVLTAMGVELGNFVAQALIEKVGDDGNPWNAWDGVLNDPRKALSPDLAKRIDKTIAESWKKMPEQRRQFLELLSRVDLTQDQADILANSETRADAGIALGDKEYLNNPYLLYESTRLTATPVGITAVDRGMFPTAFIRSRYPLPQPSTIDTAVDARRLRALTLRELEGAASRGDTLSAQATIVTSLRKRESESDESRTAVTADLLRVAEEIFEGEVRLVEMADSSRAYQLERLGRAGELIRSMVLKRVQASVHKIDADWRAMLDDSLGAMPNDEEELGNERRARNEKADALAELAARRFSVLIGPAGTGKTTLLSILCGHPAIEKDGILLLAPTGKARVRMEDVAKRAGIKNLQALTIAQFLSRSDPPRYDGATGRYLVTGKPGERVSRTVIVDECSMLTEEMTAALLEGITGVHRLIFVGDPRQLPPIGAGRPFADIVASLQPENIESRFPRIGTAYAELTVPRRQSTGERADLQLAAWFGGGVLAPGEDQVFEILAGKRKSDTIEFIRWDTPDELEAILPPILAKTLGFDTAKEEWQAFATSLGANLDGGGSAWFNVQWGDRPGSGAAAERWQILSPVRQKPWGVETLNRAIHRRYKGLQVEEARNPGKYRNIPPPMGEDQIIYGDKIINNRNTRVWKKRVYPELEDAYLANGEIGVVVGHRRTRKKNWDPDYLEIEFSTQIGRVFKFFKSHFDEEGDASLELAYALTVHKAQGSEFETVFLVLPQSTLVLTRELLYTALTRQKKKVVVLHQGSATDLQRLSSERYSATATRLTNLFGPPKPVQVGDVFLEERLIHRTSRNEAVRSKSEVIIANLLHSREIKYNYESPLELGGVVKYPDFTIEDDAAGITYYWEHCGLLHNAAYRRRWEEKLEWYRTHGILPVADGGGPHGSLIVTRDRPDGGIDSPEIAALISSVFKT